MGLAMGLESTLVAVNDDGGNGNTRHRFRHHLALPRSANTRVKAAVWVPVNR
jgi:hypothetical protein